VTSKVLVHTHVIRRSVRSLTSACPAAVIAAMPATALQKPFALFLHQINKYTAYTHMRESKRKEDAPAVFLFHVLALERNGNLCPARALELPVSNNYSRGDH